MNDRKINTDTSSLQSLMGKTTLLAKTEGTSATQWLPKAALLGEDLSVKNSIIISSS